MPRARGAGHAPGLADTFEPPHGGVETAEPLGGSNLESDDLVFFPLLYWPVTGSSQRPFGLRAAESASTATSETA